MKPLPSLKHRSPVNSFQRGQLIPKRTIKPPLEPEVLAEPEPENNSPDGGIERTP